MTYYLSKANQIIVRLIVEKIKDKKGIVEVRFNNPKKAESIIRSAYSKLDEFSWIRDKYIIKQKEDSLQFVPKQLEIDLVDEQPQIIEDQEFFDIMNILLLQQPNLVNFVRCIITEDELDSIKAWCEKSNYQVEYTEDNILKLRKS